MKPSRKTFDQNEDHQNPKRPWKKDNTIEALVEQKVKVAVTSPQMQSSIIKKTREELITICKEKSIKGYSGKKREEIVKLLSTDKDTSITNVITRKNLSS